MIKLKLPEQERELQKWHASLTAALAPVYLQHYLSRADYTIQLNEFADQLYNTSFDPNLSTDEKMLRLNTMDQRIVLSINSAVAHQTYMAVNAILQRAFPDVYAANAPQPDPAAPRPVAFEVSEEGQGDGQVQ